MTVLQGMMLHCGGELVKETDTRLNRVFDAVGGRHKPEPHGRFVGVFKETVADTGLNLDELQLALAGKRDERLYFTATVSPGPMLTRAGRLHMKLLGKGEAFMIVGRKGNGGQVAVSLYAGHRVFVCDNGMITGDSLLVHKRQTLNLDIHTELLAGLQTFLDEAEALGGARQAAAAAPITDEEAFAFGGRLLHEGLVTRQSFDSALDNYLKPTAAMTPCHPRSRLGYAEAWTQAFRPLSAQRKLESTQAVTDRLILNPQDEATLGPVKIWTPQELN